MVVLSAMVVSRVGGKMLVSRQFVPMTRSRIEGLVAAFPKLVEANSQHTFIEADGIRYVFQPLDQIYLVLITNKKSNIMEDLETLQMMAKLVRDYCSSPTEEGVLAGQFELIFAFDEVLASGHKEAVTLQQVKTYLEMDSHEEKLHKIITDSKMAEAQAEGRRQAQEIAKQRAQQRAQGLGDPYSSSSYDRDYEDRDRARDRDRDRDRDDDYSSSRDTYTPAVDPTPVQKKNKVKTKSKPLKGLRLKKAKKEDDFLTAFARQEKSTGKYVPPGGATVPTEVVEEPAPPVVVNQGNVTVKVQEYLLLLLDTDSEIQRMEIKGEMKLTVTNPDDSRVLVTMTEPTASDLKFKTPSKVHDDSWNNERTIRLANANHAWIVGSSKSTAVLKYKLTVRDPTAIPLRFSVWADQEDEETLAVTLEFSRENKSLNLEGVEIVIPCTNQPEVGSDDQSTRYENGCLVWSVGAVDADNDSGTLEFTVEESSAARLHPIQVSFDSENTFSGLQCQSVHREDGTEVDFVCHTGLTAHRFQIVNTD
jgi:hypothetical protein